MTGSKSTSDPPGRGPWRPRAAGIAAGLLVLWALALIGPDRISRPVFDGWQRMSPRPVESTRVSIVWIDEASIRAIGPWPWPRYTLARLTEVIAAQGAAVIGFDMLFPEEDRHSPAQFAALYPELAPAAAAEIARLPSMDAIFAQVIAKSPVVLGRAGLDAAADPATPALAIEAAFAGDLPPGVQSWPRALANIPEIDDVALGHGLLNADPDADGTVRRIPLVARVAGAPTPGFALELARIAAGEDGVTLESRGGQLRAAGLGGRRLAVDQDGSMRVAFGELPDSANISALDILGTGPAARRLDGRIVIVGLSGTGTADLVSTPLASKIYGASVQAAAVDAILDGDHLSRPWWSGVAEIALAVLLTIVAIMLLPRLRPAMAAALAVALGLTVVAASWLAFDAAGLLLDPVRPLIVAAAAGAVTLIELFAEGRRNQLRLRTALQDQRVAAARSAGELSAAREIQLGMLPQREALAGFDARIELDALIEPARSIGGDFYDAVRLDDHRLCFLVGDVTGKGVPAALFMALSKALTKSVLLRDDGDLGAAVSRLNNEIARDNAGDMFVTMLVGLLDTRSGLLALCNAGHEDPYRVTSDSAVDALRCEGGPPLAVVPGFRYAAEAIQLTDGDAVVILSDGITEAQDPAGGFFGNGRVAAVLERWGNRGGVAAVTAALHDAVRAFEAGSEATDDLTVLAFRYVGAPT